MKMPCQKMRSHSLDAPEGPLVEYLETFERRLTDQGYPRETSRRHLRLVADFSVWLKCKKISAQEVTNDIAQRYLHYRAQNRCRRKGNAYALRQFVQSLQEKGIVAEKAPVAQTPVDQLVNEYSLYLRQERGLASTTINRYKGIAYLFLIKLLGAKTMRLSDLSARKIIRFIQHESAHPHSTLRAQKITTALRSFLRYARYRGYIKLDLAGAVPSVARWSMESIPNAISPDEIQRAIASCDRRRAIGRRDYAMLLLLARLALRAREVATLTLDDIDWNAGTLTVHGKGDRESVLPLLKPVGESIAAYLKRGRPQSQSRRLFLRIKAPIRGFKTEKPVSAAVNRALERAGIDSPRKGAHQFRHSLATEMLRQGSSLAEIGEILRHKNPDTTRIYAKVDLHSLRTLAPPWPGA